MVGVELKAGQQVGPYVIVELLGTGGNGAVWRASDARGHAVALKLMPATVPIETQRFERGARLAETLDHPHIAKCRGLGRAAIDASEFLYLEIELLAGETLATRQAREPVLSPKEAVRIADELLSALEHVHAQHIVHRDLKPGNIFLEDAGPLAPRKVKLLDFGIAKVPGASDKNEPSLVGPLPTDDAASDIALPDSGEHEVTDQHKICGTPEYMAPEQITGLALDARSDIYAVGVVLYRMLAGVVPFRGRRRKDVYDQHLQVAPAPLPLALGVPPALERVVLRALAKSPDDRYPHAAALREALATAIARPARNAAPLFPRTRPGESRPAPAPALGHLPTTLPAPSITAHARRSGHRRQLAIGFFLASLAVLVTVIIAKL